MPQLRDSSSSIDGLHLLGHDNHERAVFTLIVYIADFSVSRRVVTGALQYHFAHLLARWTLDRSAFLAHCHRLLFRLDRNLRDGLANIADEANADARLELFKLGLFTKSLPMLRARTSDGSGCKGAERDSGEQNADGIGYDFHNISICWLMVERRAPGSSRSVFNGSHTSSFYSKELHKR